MRRIGFALALAFTLAGPALALEDGERDAGRSIIERQIEAFRRDDGEAAYGFAAPGIQGMFGSPDRFMEMVRQGYRPVYRPRSYEFGALRETERGFEQILRIQDGDGVDWDALYQLERQQDGSWKIAGCQLVKRPGENV